MQLSDSDTDTDDDYMLEDDIMDLSDDSEEDEDIGEDLCKVVCDLFRICL